MDSETHSGRKDFEALMLPHLDAAHNLARWLMRSPESAQDVVQDAFTRALTYFPQFRGVNPKAWLLQIVRNAAFSALKRHRGNLRLVTLSDVADQETPALHDPADSPERALVRRRDREAVTALLDGLPPDLREVLVLREMEDMAYRDIAEVTGTPIGTVMSRLWRARQMLAAAAPAELRNA